MDKLFSLFTAEDLYLGARDNTQQKQIKLTHRYMWQTLAVQIRIIGRQARSTENDPIECPLKTAINESITHLRALGKCAGREIIQRLISTMLLTTDFSDEISKNFYSLALSLGQYTTGDEKLKHFTGKSGNVRNCPSKPDKIGLWYYELCAPLTNDLSYMLKVSMHDNSEGPRTVASVVSDWLSIVKEVGRDVRGDNPNPKTYLAADSYYVSEAAVQESMKSQQPFSVSVRADRFSKLKHMVHPPGSKDTSGEWKGITKDATGEMFVYHYDRQKGVGIKYNYSRGFLRSTDKIKIRNHQNRIPGYGYYKFFFEVCDRFNRNLHDRYWCHKRGGYKVLGESGAHNDFIMACILQNTFNAFHAVNKRDPRETTFLKFCIELSDAIFMHSLTCDELTS